MTCSSISVVCVIKTKAIKSPAHCDEPLNKNQNKQISQKLLVQQNLFFSQNFFIHFEIVSEKKNLA
jgi:hypothetical protein